MVFEILKLTYLLNPILMFKDATCFRILSPLNSVDYIFTLLSHLLHHSQALSDQPPGQLSLAIPSWVGAMSTSQKGCDALRLGE